MAFAGQRIMVAAWVAVAVLITAPPARAAWVEEVAEFPFVLRADSSLPNAPAILSELRALEDDLVETLGIEPAKEWIEVYVYRDRAALDRFAAQLIPEIESRPALFVKGRGPAMILTHRGESLAIDLRHEATHALLHQHAAELPLWLDEGLAEYFEQPADRRSEHHPYLTELREPGALDALPTLGQLEMKTDLADLSQRDYQAAWAWAHDLLHGPPRLRATLRAYVADSADNRESVSMGDRLRRLDPRIEAAHREYLRAGHASAD